MNISPAEAGIVSVSELPPWQPDVDLSRKERLKANFLSDVRGILSEPMRELIVNTTNRNTAERSIAGIALGAGWWTDRKDGVEGRSSVNRMEILCDETPEAREDPQVQALISKETRADGARRDQIKDKDWANATTDGLLERAIEEDDLFGIVAAGITRISTRHRDRMMAKVRAQGEREGIDVKAKFWGKLKTGLLAFGQGIATVAKPKTTPSRIGFGMMLGSNIPSWLGVAQMRHHIKRAVAQKSTNHAQKSSFGLNEHSV